MFWGKVARVIKHFIDNFLFLYDPYDVRSVLKKTHFKINAFYKSFINK